MGERRGLRGRLSWLLLAVLLPVVGTAPASAEETGETLVLSEVPGSIVLRSAGVEARSDGLRGWTNFFSSGGYEVALSAYPAPDPPTALAQLDRLLDDELALRTSDGVAVRWAHPDHPDIQVINDDRPRITLATLLFAKGSTTYRLRFQHNDPAWVDAVLEAQLAHAPGDLQAFDGTRADPTRDVGSAARWLAAGAGLGLAAVVVRAARRRAAGRSATTSG